MKRVALLVLATGLLTLASGQTSGHTASPMATLPATAFHSVTEDFPPTHPPAALIDDFTQPSPIPRPSVVPPTAKPIVVVKAAPRPRPRPVVSSTVVRYPTVADAKAYALRVLGSTQYACLNQIAIHESNWNPRDYNASSGAYGIPQALPGSKMSTAGADWRYNPVTQVKWMIGYVDARYGSACAAWSYWQSHHWY